MEIKFNIAFSTYRYLVMFDLASKVTGVCLWDIKNNKPVQTSILKVSGQQELPAAELYNLIDNYFQALNKSGILLSEVIVYKEAMPTQLRGGNSTVQTFIALARSHAILDLYTYMHNIAIYDYTGVYPASTHAYFKKIKGWSNDHSVQKADIRDYIQQEYKLENLSLDESDSVFLAKTFVDVKWNKDLDEKIKEIKRHCKTLKANHAIEACGKEIQWLVDLKI